MRNSNMDEAKVDESNKVSFLVKMNFVILVDGRPGIICSCVWPLNVFNSCYVDGLP